MFYERLLCSVKDLCSGKEIPVLGISILFCSVSSQCSGRSGYFNIYNHSLSSLSRSVMSGPLLLLLLVVVVVVL